MAGFHTKTFIKNWKSDCNFECFYYCYKMNLEKDIIFLE